MVIFRAVGIIVLKWPIFEEMISAIIKSSTCEKLLGVKVDYKVKFSEHLDGIFEKASHRVAPYLGFSLHGLNEKTRANKFIFHFAN